MKKSDTLREILEAPDCAELMEWLRQQKLMHYDEQREVAMVHAGIPPQWSLRKALKYAEEVETALRDDNLLPPSSTACTATNRRNGTATSKA